MTSRALVRREPERHLELERPIYKPWPILAIEALGKLPPALAVTLVLGSLGILVGAGVVLVVMVTAMATAMAVAASAIAGMATVAMVIGAVAVLVLAGGKRP